MKKTIGFLCTSLLVFLLTAVIDVSNVYADQFLFVKIVNYKNSTVSLCFARENGYKPADNSTVGWFNVPARTQKTIKVFRYNANDNYYWYAKSNGEVIVSGRDFSGWIKPGSAFKSKNGRKLGGGTRVGFRALNERQGKATITLGKR